MRVTVATLAAVGMLAGCISLGKPPARPRYYILEPVAAPGPVERPGLPAIGLGPVELPAYLDRRGIVTRSGPARVDVASTDRWAAPLDELFTTAVGEALRAAVPARDVVAWPPAGKPWPEWSVSVEVVRFDGEPDGTGVLEARWTIRRAGAVARQGATTAREPGTGTGTGMDSTVAALSRAVGALAQDIAAAVDATGAAAREQRGAEPRATDAR